MDQIEDEVFIVCIDDMVQFFCKIGIVCKNMMVLMRLFGGKVDVF